MEDKEKTIKEDTFDRIVHLLQEEGQRIQSDNESILDQLTRMNIIIDMIKFINNYDENIRVLNAHYLSKSKFER